MRKVRAQDLSLFSLLRTGALPTTVLCYLLLWILSVDVARAADYRLVLGKGTEVCEAVLKLYNDRALTDAEDPASVPAPGFSKIEWREMGKLTPSLQEQRGLFSHALVDLDNDGQVDWVVRIRAPLSAELSDMLMVYRNQKYPLNPEGGFGVEHWKRSAEDTLYWGGQDYLLKKIPKYRFKDGSGSGYHSIMGQVNVIPFRFKDKTFIVIASDDLVADFRENRYLVIAEYTQKAKVNDLCYVTVSPNTSQPDK